MNGSRVHDCQPNKCVATFSVDGQRGVQQLLGGGCVRLQADDLHAEQYQWELITSPVSNQQLLAGALLPQAQLALPVPGVYVVQLTVNNSCTARQTLWVTTSAGCGPQSQPLNDCCLSEDDQAAIEQAEGTPNKDNPFVTTKQLNDFGREHFLSQDDKDAIEQAEGHPDAQNPFVTTKQLNDFGREHFLSQDDKDAIEQAEGHPDGQNPFVTTKQLNDLGRDHFLSQDDKDAIEQAEGTPSAGNPFVTTEQWRPTAPTPEQKAALDGANNPSGGNPFATLDDVDPLPGATRQALLAATQANKDNRFATLADVPPQKDWLTQDQLAALRSAHAPTEKNFFATQADLIQDPYKGAIEAATQANKDNRFATLADVPPQKDWLTQDQLAALRSAHAPTEKNFFATQADLIQDPYKGAIEAATQANKDNRFATLADVPPQKDWLTQDQLAALRSAHAPTEKNFFATQADLIQDPYKGAIEAATQANKDNRFATLADVPPQKDWLTQDQLAALRSAHAPTEKNFFATQADLIQDPYKGAIEAATQANKDNRFATLADVPPQKDWLTQDQLAALRSAHAPTEKNFFATQADLIQDPYKGAIEAATQANKDNRFATLADVPPQKDWLTQDQLAALRSAHAPTEKNFFATQADLIQDPYKGAIEAATQANKDNRFATLADLPPIGPIVSRTLAAGNLDLSGAVPGRVLGGLRVVDNTLGWGQALLTFTGYQPGRRDYYVIKALPINAGVSRQQYNEFIVTQFVEFRPDGFVLQMTRPLVHGNGQAALGPCMVEVSEIVAELPSPVWPTIQEAINAYYNRYLAAGQYGEAWTMLSGPFRQSLGLTNPEDFKRTWEKSGPATLIGYEAVQVDSGNAVFNLSLDYRNAGVIYHFRYEFKRDELEGDPRFGYWLFESGRELERNIRPQGPFQEIWSRLSQQERTKLGEARTPLIADRNFTLQRFERSLMYWFDYPDPAQERIWVLRSPQTDFKSGNEWHAYVDDWQETADLYSCSEAQAHGPAGPIRGFGRLWCNKSEVWQAVGKPVGPEAGSGEQPPFGSAQFFEGGIMFFRPKRPNDMLNNTNQVFVLFNEQGWRRLDM